MPVGAALFITKEKPLARHKKIDVNKRRHGAGVEQRVGCHLIALVKYSALEPIEGTHA